MRNWEVFRRPTRVGAKPRSTVARALLRARVIICLRSCGMSHAEIARFFGFKNAATSQIIYHRAKRLVGRAEAAANTEEGGGDG